MSRRWTEAALTAGGMAQCARVLFADIGPIKVPEGITHDRVLFLSDIFPTGYMAAEMCNLKGGETIAVRGCGPVGQFAIRTACLLGAGRVIAIDRIPVRNRGLNVKTGQTLVQRHLQPVMDRIVKGEIDPGFVITHHMRLDDAPQSCDTFRNERIPASK